MFYARINLDGTLARYPYTVTDLRFETPNTSFPSQLSADDLSDFGLVPVALTEQPALDYTKNVERSAVNQRAGWIETWLVSDASPAEVSERMYNKARAVRVKRNDMLTDSDGTQIADAPVNQAAWAGYRQALRDISGQPGFPWTITWPEAPTV